MPTLAPPVILAVVPDVSARAALDAALQQRYASNYTVVVIATPADALAHLSAYAAEETAVALVLAPLRMADPGGVAFLIDARRLQPTARRLLMIDVGDADASDALGQALTLNHADAYFGQPWANPEEELHPVVGDALRLWAIAHQPRYEKAVIVDDPNSTRGPGLHHWLARNQVVTTLVTTDSPDGQTLLAGALADADGLPALLLWDGRVLSNPTDHEVAESLGARTRPSHEHYDVAIVGMGPAGLAAAVYCGSEGLRAISIETDAIGGQAGTSSKIRNYLGFPWGISGGELAERASRQAQQLGAEFIVARSVIQLDAKGDDRILTLSNGDAVIARAVVIAAGVTYNRLDIPSVDALVDAGVFYGAAVSEMQTMNDLDVAVLGAGNSAGQAAAHLAAGGARVTVIVRRASLEKTMSDYLIHELEASPNITVCPSTTVVGAYGHQRLDALELRSTIDDTTRTLKTDALFIFIGARPHSAWLEGSLDLDEHGFLCTGANLETSMPGVFAAGDIRHGSVKRVAAAVGEGSTAAMMVRDYLTR